MRGEELIHKMTVGWSGTHNTVESGGMTDCWLTLVPR